MAEHDHSTRWAHNIRRLRERLGDEVERVFAKALAVRPDDQVAVALRLHLPRRRQVPDQPQRLHP